MTVQPWKRIEPTEVQKVGWRTIVTKNFVLPNGNEHGFQIVNGEDTHNAGVIGITKDKQVIVAKQFRPGPEKLMHEIAGGGVEKGETDYQTTALRELKEETGYVPTGAVTHLGDVYKDAYNNSTWHYYLAEDCELHPDGQQLDEHEFVEPVLVSIDEFLEFARSGGMTDVEAVFLAYDKLLELKNS